MAHVHVCLSLVWPLLNSAVNFLTALSIIIIKDTCSSILIGIHKHVDVSDYAADLTRLLHV